MTPAATPAAEVPNQAVPVKGQLLPKAARLPVRTVGSVLMALTYGIPGMLIFLMLARICRKGPVAADESRNGADGAKTPAAG